MESGLENRGLFKLPSNMAQVAIKTSFCCRDFLRHLFSPCGDISLKEVVNSSCI